ncbi:hypothetical protein FGO68_gene7761 [Halteria grandinella]|uniref:K Homology domain-containing protein n=1 Tax=Halteria grandinella TaxID=5974 RepID=A0A8J8T8D3_HALGN|nr:hypothetical protein FGO68_gene7761 [Halteria grandinella]
MMTPYGPANPNAYIVPVPHDCVGLIIGKGGETIRNLQIQSGAKIQVAKKEIQGTKMRNVFIEGTFERFELAKKLIDEIVHEARRLNKTQNPNVQVSINQEVNPFPGPHVPFPIPNSLTGLIIGKSGDTIKQIHNRCGAYVFIPKYSDPNSGERILELSGSEEQIERARKEIQKVLSNAAYVKTSHFNNFNNQSNTSDSTYSSDVAPNDKRQDDFNVPSTSASEDAIYKYMETLIKNKDVILNNQ